VGRSSPATPSKADPAQSTPEGRGCGSARSRNRASVQFWATARASVDGGPSPKVWRSQTVGLTMVVAALMGTEVPRHRSPRDKCEQIVRVRRAGVSIHRHLLRVSTEGRPFAGAI
jgi:hypothetical protein